MFNFFPFFLENIEDFNTLSTIEVRKTDVTMPDSTKFDDSILSTSVGTTPKETTHYHTSTKTTTAITSSIPASTSTIMESSSSVSSTSSSSAATSTEAHKSTAYYAPSQTTSITVQYTIKETIPTEPIFSEHESGNELDHPETPSEYDDSLPDPPIPEPETEPPSIYRPPPPINPNSGIYGNNVPTRATPKNKHGRINSEAEERTAMIIGCYQKRLSFDTL